ncbi:MAG TPA: universal stress protein [Ramlibacter sp.]
MTTPYRQVLVHLDASASAGARLAAARSLAQEHGAALAALYATVPVYLELPYPPEGAPGLASSLMDVEDERRRAARRTFDEAMRTPGPTATWAETREMPAAGAFVAQALHADLLVLGQHDPAGAANGVPPDFAESVVLASGKPALVLPYTGAARRPGGTAAIAWKETREAARAVSAAMPLLQRAGRVHVLAWEEEPALEVRGQQLDLDGYLRLHGIVPTWHRGGRLAEPLGEILLSQLSDLDADLLVMGCYGHSRAREWILGGTSRTVLRSMTLPVLMAH